MESFQIQLWYLKFLKYWIFSVACSSSSYATLWQVNMYILAIHIFSLFTLQDLKNWSKIVHDLDWRLFNVWNKYGNSYCSLIELLCIWNRHLLRRFQLGIDNVYVCRYYVCTDLRGVSSFMLNRHYQFDLHK